MNTNLSSKRKSVRAGGLSLAMTMAMGLVGAGTALTPRPAHAVFASEPTQILNNISLLINQFQDYAAYADDIARWQQQIQGMRDQLASLQNMAVNLGINPNQDMQPVNENTYMVEERCGDQYGGGTAGLFGRLTGVNLNSDIYKQQYDICWQMQRTENKRYNDTLEYLKRSYERAQSNFSQLQQMNRTANNIGNSNKANQSASEVNFTQEAEFKNFQTKMLAYDGHLASLERTQQALGKGAMRGKAGLRQKVTSAGVVYAALCGGGKCND